MDDHFTYIDDLTNQIPEVPPDSILSRSVFNGDRLKAVLFRFAAGQELSEHTSSVPAVIHILDGSGRLILGGETVEARPGAWAHLPAHLPHTVIAETPLTMLLLMLK